MKEHYPRIRIYMKETEEPLLHIRDGVGVAFYMKRSHQAVAQAVLRALDVYRRAVKPQALAWYMDPYSTDWSPLDDAGWAYVLDTMNELGMQVWLAGSPNSSTGFEVLYDGRLLESPDTSATATSAIAFFLPTESMEEHGPGWLWELACALARELPFDSGHAGLCFNFPEHLRGDYVEAIRELSLRYPGLNVPAVRDDSYCIGTRINGVHWMNFLGPPVLEELGGVEALRTRLHSPTTTVKELEPGRAVVTLGDWPEAGDLQLGHTLPDHRELARVLEPWLYLGRRGWGESFGGEDMRRWERRFLDP